MAIMVFYIASAAILWIVFASHVGLTTWRLGRAGFDREQYNDVRSFLKNIQRFFLVFISGMSIPIFMDFSDEESIRAVKAVANILVSVCMAWVTGLIVAHIELLQLDNALEDARTVH